jgi:hypothetical protein
VILSLLFFVDFSALTSEACGFDLCFFGEFSLSVLNGLKALLQLAVVLVEVNIEVNELNTGNLSDSVGE